MGKIGRSVWLELSFSCDLQALVDLMKDIDSKRPVILTRNLEIARGDGPQPDRFLQVKIELGQIWRAGVEP